MKPETILYIHRILAEAQTSWFENMQTCQKYSDSLKNSNAGKAEIDEADRSVNECAQRVVDIAKAVREFDAFFGLSVDE